MPMKPEDPCHTPGHARSVRATVSDSMFRIGTPPGVILQGAGLPLSFGALLHILLLVRAPFLILNPGAKPRE